VDIGNSGGLNVKSVLARCICRVARALLTWICDHSTGPGNEIPHAFVHDFILPNTLIRLVENGNITPKFVHDRMARLIIDGMTADFVYSHLPQHVIDGMTKEFVYTHVPQHVIDGMTKEFLWAHLRELVMRGVTTEDIGRFYDDMIEAALSAGEWYGDFGEDPFPGRPRILFIGDGQSSHGRSWMDLLAESTVNTRLFALPGSPPLPDMPYRVHVSYAKAPMAGDLHRGYSADMRRAIGVGEALFPERQMTQAMARRLLAEVIRTWRPHVIHTFGLSPAAEFYAATRAEHGVDSGRWVLQLRGGSDLAFRRDQKTVELATSADLVLSDNEINYRILAEMGAGLVRRPQSFRRVPGTGGIPVARTVSRWSGPTAGRQTILWPKAYEARWSKGVSVLEALRLAWPRLKPCRIVMTPVSDEIRDWLNGCSADLQAACELHHTLGHAALIEEMLGARVMLAPSLVDGTPNVMWEAMAAGAIPIVSPLPSIRSVVGDEHVLFARNLYPEEIADAIVRAMSDDDLATRIAEGNRRAVVALAGRETFAPLIADLYEQLWRDAS
jgi:glycosyltransferase involved in cell wall biosynthesis